jgi:hypothetical protein
MEIQQTALGSVVAASVALLIMACCASAETKSYPKAKVSFDDYKNLVAEVASYRAKRLVGLDTFLVMSKEPGTIVLDTRSDFRFERLHLKGARHLSFTDFTQENLAKVIPSFQTRILIYCNNNFEGNPTDFATKIVLPASGNLLNGQVTSLTDQITPATMALNIPTYINLYGYGYHDIYELDELVDVHDPRIDLAGTAGQN